MSFSTKILAVNTSFLLEDPVLEEGRGLALGMCAMGAACLQLDMHQKPGVMGPGNTVN